MKKLKKKTFNSHSELTFFILKLLAGSILGQPPKWYECPFTFWKITNKNTVHILNILINLTWPYQLKLNPIDLLLIFAHKPISQVSQNISQYLPLFQVLNFATFSRTDWSVTQLTRYINSFPSPVHLMFSFNVLHNEIIE